MNSVIAAAAAVYLGGAAAAAAVGGRRIKKAFQQAPPEPERWPKIAVVVPAAGADEGTAECFTALAGQNYPDYELILAAADAGDPAFELFKDAAHAGRVVVAGTAQTSGQKNHNLLAGLQAASPDREVYAFCDSTRRPRPDFLLELVRPLARNEADVSTGYHHVIPGDSLPAIGQSAVVMAMHLAQAIPLLGQPWGGALAIGKPAFNDLGVADLWAENVVDDVSLARRLADRRVRLAFAPRAVLQTPLTRQSLKGWLDWLTRQILYLKFCFPAVWLGVGAGLVGLALLFAWSIGAVFSAPADPAAAIWGAGFLLGMVGLGFAARRLHPRPGPPGKSLLALAAAVFMAPAAFIRTIPQTHIAWRGIRYQVGPGGKVTRIVR